MRLGNVVDEKSSSGGEGQGIGRNKNKRSSLDFKASSYHSNGSPITTKPGKRKNRQQQQQQQQQYEEEQLKQQQARRPYLSRARGHSGPPPRKWELADLQHMNEEELLQALYADPELAQEAARMTERIAAEKGGPSSGRPSASPSRRPTTTSSRGKRGSAAGRNGPSEYPDHMRELMDGGVPVIQWLIILVLLGAAFYQLRMILSLPDSNSTKDPFKRRSRGKGEAKHGAKKAKASSDLGSLEKVALAIDADIQGLENDKGGTFKPTNKKSTAATKKQKVKKEKGNTKNNPTTTTTTTASNKKQADATDDNSVGSDDADFPGTVAAVKVAPSARVPATPPVTAIARMTNDDDEDMGDANGWQTVSKTTRGVVESTGIPVEAKSLAQPVPKTTPSPAVPVVVVESKENTPPPATMTASLNGQNDPSGKEKKEQMKDKGKSGAKTNNHSTDPASAVSAVVGMEEDDAALAQELQREEDNMAHQNKTNKNKTSDSDNTWEEVSTRKRKGSTSKPDAATNG